MEYNNILIIKMSSLGDIIHALPFAAALRRRFPRARISWLVHPQFSAFVPEAPLIDEVLYFDKAAFKKMRWSDKVAYAKKMRRELHSKKFDLVIDLQGLFKSGALAYLTGCKNKIGHLGIHILIRCKLMHEQLPFATERRHRSNKIHITRKTCYLAD